MFRYRKPTSLIEFRNATRNNHKQMETHELTLNSGLFSLQMRDVDNATTVSLHCSTCGAARMLPVVEGGASGRGPVLLCELFGPIGSA